jgi:DNA-binding CsgD family transcriptional regulator
MQIKDADVMNSLLGLLSVNFENLLSLPCYVFWKDILGTYLGYNDYGANNLGYSSGKEIAGKNDYEIFPTAIAELYRRNDAEAVGQHKQILAPERGILKDNVPIIFLSYKMPLYRHDEVVGVIGLSFARSITDNTCNVLENPFPNKFAEHCNYFPKKPVPNHSDLSDKEKECVRHLCFGLTTKMIGRKLCISNKTVETYIARAKSKLGCHNKAQLIMAFIKNFGEI